ncbi:MAG: hypothetical protein J6J86_00335 [Lachnospiraceae bacterium]|nr:hypothetical protein [Lachnospiraceae bacterium]
MGTIKEASTLSYRAEASFFFSCAYLIDSVLDTVSLPQDGYSVIMY